MRWKRAQVVLTEGNRKSLISRLIKWATGSWYTHAFIITGPDEAVEATFPRLRKFTLSKRMDKLAKDRRGYLVLDFPGILPQTRYQVAKKALGYVGRLYDILQLFIYGITGRFIRDGTGRMVCSRLVTASYRSVGLDLFPPSVLDRYPENFNRLDNLKNGYATPVDLLYSRLRVVHEQHYS